MFKNAFANLQKVGKSLMLPVSVLPIAGILLGVGSANFSWLPAVVSHVMAEAGGSVFANMPLIFAIGVALGFTNNDGVSALAAVVAYGIMVKTMAVAAPLVLHLPAEEIAAKHLADTGVLGGIISGAIAAYMFNRFYRIKLPEYLVLADNTDRLRDIALSHRHFGVRSGRFHAVILFFTVYGVSGRRALDNNGILSREGGRHKCHRHTHS